MATTETSIWWASGVRVHHVETGVTRVRLGADARCRRARRLIAGDTIDVAQVGDLAELRAGVVGPYEVVVLEVE